MKYVIFWETTPEDMEKCIEKFVKRQQMRNVNPEKYDMHLTTDYSIGGQLKGLRIVEATPEQVQENVVYWLPELKQKYMPLIEAAKIMEDYMKSKSLT